ncbi:MAG: hypothetical protein F6J93_17535 [Oscillatoria sp. SIO1A7]|nr:hypothetical protein [Oscillatoria sp. SIO1A7]
MWEVWEGWEAACEVWEELNKIVLSPSPHTPHTPHTLPFQQALNTGSVARARLIQIAKERVSLAALTMLA